MQARELTKTDDPEILAITGQIAFYNELQHESPEQFSLLLEHSRLVDFEPSELISSKQDTGPQFYALVRGSVDVYPDDSLGSHALSQLSPGQLFGVLAVLNRGARSATLVASHPEGARVLVTDFSLAGELNDFSAITLTTKLGLYRHVVNNTRWKLEVYKNSTDDPTLAQELSLFGLFEGTKGSMEELAFLAKQSMELASLLESWNDVVEPDIKISRKTAHASKLNKVLGLFRK